MSIPIDQPLSQSTSAEEEMSRIVELIHEDSLTLDPQNLNDLLSLLVAPPPPNITTTEGPEEIQAFTLLWGLWKMTKNVRLAVLMNPDNVFPVPELTNAWPDIWRWILHLNKSAVDIRSKTVGYTGTLNSGDHLLFRTTSFILAILCNCPPAMRAVTSTPGVFALLIDILILQGNLDLGLGDVTVSEECASTIMCLKNLVEYDAPGVAEIDSAPIAGLKALSITLGAMVRAATSPDVDGETPLLVVLFPSLLQTIAWLTLRSPRLTRTLLSQNFVEDLCGVLAALTPSNPFIAVPSMQIQRNRASIMSFVITTTGRDTNGFIWTTKALSAGIIASVLQCGSRDNEILEPGAIDVLINITSSTPFLSVLEVAQTAVRDPIIAVLEAHWQISRTSLLWTSWLDFKEVLQRRLGAKSAFENCDEDGEDEFNRCAARNVGVISGNDYHVY